MRRRHKNILKTFRPGGIHPPENKLTSGSAIEPFALPQTVTIPLSQHKGVPATAIVSVGDKVKAGQLIAAASAVVSSNIHSSVSGTVTAIDSRPDAVGLRQPAISIKVEGDQWDDKIDLSEDIVTECDLSSKEIVDRIADAGIVGMGGAMFPSHVKLSCISEKKIEFLIINGAECEPYVTADHRVMLERGEEMVVGCIILAKALGVEKIYIGIENNKADAISHLRNITGKYRIIEIVPLKVRYPQGSEKQLIYSITGREVPSCGLPADVGVIVFNVSTALAVYEAVQKNKPLIERTVTVTGKGVRMAANLRVRIGTPVSSLIEYCEGGDGTGKIILGGPMMGRAIIDPETPVTKGTSCVLMMEESESKRPAVQSCIKCGRCIYVCPMALEPYLLYKFGARAMYSEMEVERTVDCVECGSCSYVCPAGLPLLDYIRLGKCEIMKIRCAREATVCRMAELDCSETGSMSV